MKKILLVIDFQKDFVDGSLGFEGADRLDSLILDKIQAYRNANLEVAFTFDTHPDNYLETQEGKSLPVEHCIENTDGWQLFGKVKDSICEKDKRFLKPTFGSSELLDYLKKEQFDEIEIVGLVTNICVIANAVIAKTALPEAKIIVDAQCVDSFDKELHEKALDVMESFQIKVINRK